MKTLTTKLFALTLIAALSAGCASVTDAGLQPERQQPAVEQSTPAPAPDNTLGGTDVEPIADKPE